jgi:hypothetical protein
MNNFIDGWFVKDIDLCDELIQAFKESNDKAFGRTFNGVNTSEKESTDVSFNHVHKKIIDKYFAELQEVLNQYIKKYHFCNECDPYGISEMPNIQYYKPNEGYHAWHCERSNAEYPVSARHLVYMTYLNDVTDGGETEWYYQKLKIKPKKGYTVIWPVDWTHTHRGIPSPTQEKYIVTGWINFL